MFPGACYHVMSRGAGRQKIFHQTKHYDFFLNLMEETTTRFGVEIHAYCLMGNHYHLLLKTPEANLSRIMRHINGVYTQRFNKCVKRDGPLLRGRYKAILVDADNYWLQLSRYIHLNPVKANMATLPELYPWSSYSTYIGRTEKPSFLNVTNTLSYFQTDTPHRAYKEFVDCGIDNETSEIFLRDKLPTILGSKKFLNHIKQTFNTPTQISREISERSILNKHITPTLDHIAALTIKHHKTSYAEFIKKGKHKKANDARNQFIFIAAKYAGYRYIQIAKYLSIKNEYAIAKTVERVSKQPPEAHEEIKKIISTLSLMSNVKT